MNHKKGKFEIPSEKTLNTKQSANGTWITMDSVPFFYLVLSDTFETIMITIPLLLQSYSSWYFLFFFKWQCFLHVSHDQIINFVLKVLYNALHTTCFIVVRDVCVFFFYLLFTVLSLLSSSVTFLLWTEYLLCFIFPFFPFSLWNILDWNVK